MGRVVGAFKLAVGVGALYAGAQAFNLSAEHAITKISHNSPLATDSQPQDVLFNSMEDKVDMMFFACSAAGAVALVLGAGMTIQACAELLPTTDKSSS